VAVHFLDREPEGAPFGGQRLEIENLGRWPGGLDLVVVDQHGQVAQPVLARR
jgi:hypothetical protein